MDQISANNKPYDLTVIYSISENNQQFLDKLLLIFSETIAKDVEAMKEAAQKGNWKEVAKTAHKIKPSVTHFGINSLKDVILNLEYQENQDIHQLNSLMLKLERVINDVLSHLKAEFPGTFNQ